jgi:hypothetical protein
MTSVPNDDPGQLLWALERGGAGATCVLRDLGRYGIEAAIYVDGRFVIGRRFESKPVACEWAENRRQRLEEEGWRRGSRGDQRPIAN